MSFKCPDCNLEWLNDREECPHMIEVGDFTDGKVKWKLKEELEYEKRLGGFRQC